MSIPRESYTEQKKFTEINTQEQLQENVYTNVIQEDNEQSMNMESRRDSLVSLNDSYLQEAPVQSIQDAKEKIKESYSRAGNKVKAVKEKVEYVPKHVSLDGTFEVDESYDSKKMIEVKEAISRYNAVKGTVTAKSVLETVIKACDRYTKWKFSLFKFGEAAERLKEVKKVRADAQREYDRLKEEDKKLSRKERQNNNKKRIEEFEKDEKFYAPELNTLYKEFADQTSGEQRAIMKAKIDGLRDHYPAMTYSEAELLVVKLSKKGYDLGSNIRLDLVDKEVSKSALDSAVLKRNKEAEKEAKKIAEEEQRRLKEERMSTFDFYIKDYNPLSRFFYKYIFSTPIQNQILKDKIIVIHLEAESKRREAEEREKEREEKRKDSFYSDNNDDYGDADDLFI